MNKEMEQWMIVVEMRMLRWMCRMTEENRIRNEYTNDSVLLHQL